MKNLRTTDLNLLKAFEALMDERNVTRAAERLAVTQPAVSGMLNRLRHAFGDPLFVRTPRGIAPTPRALELAEPIKQALARIEEIFRPSTFDPQTADFTLSIAATDYALRAVVMPFLAALRPLAPLLRVAIRPVDEARVQQQLERGELDLALLTPETTTPELHARRLFDERYVCAMRKGHPAARKGRLTLERFSALDHAIVSLAGGGFHGPTDEALQRLGLARHVAVSMPSFLSLLDVLRTSELIALVPSRLVAQAADFAVVEPPLEVRGFTKVAAWHARANDAPGHRWARGLLFQVCEAGQAAS